MLVLTSEDIETVFTQVLNKPVGAVGTAGAGAGGRSRKRLREPLTSVVKLLPEYLPEELYSSSDRRWVL